MSYTPKSTLYNWFKTNKKPTQEQFWAWMDSYRHESELIPLNQIEDIDVALEQTVSVDTFNSHLSDENAHSLYLTKVDASNLSPENIIDWKDILGVGVFPENMATVDDDTSGNVYLKIQSDALYMSSSDFVLNNGKINCEKLDLSTLNIGYKDYLKISDPVPIVPGLYKLIEVGQYSNLIPAVDSDGNPGVIESIEGMINDVYFNGSVWKNTGTRFDIIFYNNDFTI